MLYKDNNIYRVKKNDNNSEILKGYFNPYSHITIKYYNIFIYLIVLGKTWGAHTIVG